MRRAARFIPDQAPVLEPLDLIARITPETMRDDAPQLWRDLIWRKCRTASAAAIRFGVTLQTACNWLEGTGVPMGDKVALAALWWPDDFRRAFGGGQ